MLTDLEIRLVVSSFFYCGILRYRFSGHFATGCNRTLSKQSSSWENTPVPSGKGRISCRAWRARCALQLEQRSTQGSFWAAHTPEDCSLIQEEEELPEGRWHIYWSIKRRLQEQTQICGDVSRTWDIMASLLIYFHLFLATCSCSLRTKLRVISRTIFSSGIFAFVGSEAQKIRRQKHKGFATALFLWWRGYNGSCVCVRACVRRNEE